MKFCVIKKDGTRKSVEDSPEYLDGKVVEFDLWKKHLRLRVHLCRRDFCGHYTCDFDALEDCYLGWMKNLIVYED